MLVRVPLEALASTPLLIRHAPAFRPHTNPSKETMAKQLTQGEFTPINLANFAKRFVEDQNFPADCEVRFSKMGKSKSPHGNDLVTVRLPFAPGHIKPETKVTTVIEMVRAALAAHEDNPSYKVQLWGPNEAKKKNRTVKLTGSIQMKTLLVRLTDQKAHVDARELANDRLAQTNAFVDDLVSWAKSEHKQWRVAVRELLTTAMTKHRIS